MSCSLKNRCVNYDTAYCMHCALIDTGRTYFKSKDSNPNITRDDAIGYLHIIRHIYESVNASKYVEALDLAIDSISDNYEKIRADERRKVVKSIQEQVSSINNEYVDACVMCTKLNCDECFTKTIIELLEKILDVVRKEVESDD